MADITKSPLLDPGFIERASASDTLAGALSSDSPLVEQIAVSERKDNDLTNEGLGKDLTEMTHGELVTKYGEEVANNRINIQAEMANQRRTLDDKRTPGQIASDTLLSVGTGAVNLIGGVTAATTGVAGKADQAVDPKNTGLLEISTGVAEATSQASDFLTGFQSDELKARQNLSNVERGLDIADSQAQYDRDVENGDNSFVAALAREGRNALATGERILDDGAIASDVLAQAAGSLGPSAKLAKGGSDLLTAATSRVTANETAKRTASTIGVSGGVGVAEASGTYNDTVNAVLGYSYNQLAQSSEQFNELLDQGVDPAEARRLVAADTGLEAYQRQLPTAAAIGLLATRFNASPTTAFQGQTLLGGLREVGAQALEEGLQGGSSQVNQNIALRDNVDDSIQVTEGLGETVATGALAGTGLAGGIAVTSPAFRALGNLPLPKGNDGTFNAPGNVDLKKAFNAGKNSAAIHVIPETADDISVNREVLLGSEYRSDIENYLGEIGMTGLSLIGEGSQKTVMANANHVVRIYKGDPETYPESKHVLAPKYQGMIGDFHIEIMDKAKLQSVPVRLIRHYLGSTTKLGDKLLDDNVLFADNHPGNVARYKGKDVAIDGVKFDPETTNTRVIPGLPKGSDVAGTREVSQPDSLLNRVIESAVSSINTDPTEAQKKAGNYAKGHVKVGTFDVSIENAKGSERSGTDADGESWSVNMPAHYGDIKGTTGADGDPLDIYIGDNADSATVAYVVNQVDSNTGKFDEHKIMYGFSSIEEATSTYDAGFSDGLGPQRRSNVVPVTTDALQNWIKNSDTTKPFDEALAVDESTIPPAPTSTPSSVVETVTNAVGKAVETAKSIASPALNSVKEYASDTVIEVKTDLNKTQTADTEVNFDTVDETVNVAKSNPANVNPDFVNKILEQPSGVVSDEDVRLLKAASKIATAVNNHAGEQVEISKNNRVALSKKPAYQANPKELDKRHPLLDIKDASRSIQVGGFRDAGGNSLRSVNDFAADIFVGSQSEDLSVENSDGVLVPVATVANQFKMFREHMTNKLAALEESARIYNETGKTKAVGFRSLYRGREMVNAGDARGSKPVTYNVSEKASVFNAELANDARVTAEVYNTLAETFPDLFPEGKLPVPAGFNQTKEETNEGQAQEESRVAEVQEDEGSSETPENTQEAVEEVSEVEPDNTTVVEEGSDAQAVEPTEQPLTEDEQTAVDEVTSEVRVFDLSEVFQEAFEDTGRPVDYTNGEELIELVENSEYKRIAKILLRPMMVKMNSRLHTTPFFNKKPNGPSVADAIKDPKYDVQSIRDYKNTIFVDQNSIRYNSELLSIATVVVIDWMSSVRSMDPSQLKETLEKLGVNYSNLTKEDVTNIMYGVSTRQASETITNQVIKTWGLKYNIDSSIIDGRGAVETLVKELLTVSNEIGMIDIMDIPNKVNGIEGTVQTLNVNNTKIRDFQAKIGLDGQNSIAKIISPADVSVPSFGEKITDTDQTQSRGNVKLSPLEKRALKRIQDTPHFISEGVTQLVDALGFPVLNEMLGYRDDSNLSKDHPLRASIAGKNLSIERDYADALAVVKSIRDIDTEEDVPVYYPVGISKVGRHQFKGINPQNNKILRAMVTPTHSNLDMTNQADQDAFWLTVAQAADLGKGFKVENDNHSDILANVEDAFVSRFGVATDLTVEWLETGTMNVEAFKEAMGTASMAQLAAVEAVAEYRFAKVNGTEASFDTTLSFELDGKTDGPANMMSNFGQGQVTQSDMSNFQRVGFFLGNKVSTLNKHFTSGNIDLYEITSDTAQSEMMKRIANAKDGEKRSLIAVANFSAAFGDLKIKNDEYEMTRSTSKSPMTKTVYGSGVRGVATGIASDMVIEFYEQMLKVPTGQKASEFLGYPTLEEDFEVLFGTKFDNSIDWTSAYLDSTSTKLFDAHVEEGLGEILSSSAKKVIGNPITKVNDALVFITNVQTNFLQLLFQRKLAELADKRMREGKLRGGFKNLDGKTEYKYFTKSELHSLSNNPEQPKPIIREISHRDYNGLVAELRAYAPTYSNGSQTLAVGSFDNQVSDIELSSNMNGDMRMKSNMQAPSLAGVKVIPYLSIGRGDAMMMNTIYGSDNAPTDTLPVFDGIDMPVNRVKEYADRINGAVMQNWDRDILGDVENDFDNFLNSVGSETALLAQAFAATAEVAKDTTVTAKNTNELMDALKEMHRQNQARKAAFKRIPVSVDHMGGSNSAYTRGDDVVMDLGEINRIIQGELSGKPVSDVDYSTETPDIGVEQDIEPEAKEGEFSKLVVTQASSLLVAMLKETRNKTVNKTLKAIAPLITTDAKVVMGSLDQLQEYRALNYQADGVQLTDANGMYDVANNVIYIANNNHETITHELVHMVSYNKVLDHYNGSKDDAVVRLEGLMGEFLDLDLKGPEANAIQASVLLNQNNNTPESKAAALNEFMAWTLSNEKVATKLNNTPMIARLTKKVKLLMQRLLGNVPTDLFSNILFNTVNLGQEIETNDNGGNDNNGDGGLTKGAHKFTNYWLNLVRERLSDSGNADGSFKRDRLNEYTARAKDITVQLDFGGFNLSEYQKQTFMAIHVVLASEMQLDPRSSVAINKVFDHVTANLSPEMFGEFNQQERFTTVMNLFGSTTNRENVSDAIAVLLALSQTSNGFRNALDQLPVPETVNTSDGSLNDMLEGVTGTLMRKAIGTIDTNKDAGSVLDELSESIIQQDSEKEFSVIKRLMSSIDRADVWTSGAMSKLAERADAIDNSVRQSDRDKLTKAVVGSVATAAQFLDEDRSKIAAQGLKNAVHMGVALDNFVPVREFVSEVVGTDKTNKEVVALLDRTNFSVQSARQAYREDLPGVLSRGFENEPTADQWKTMHKVLGKTDFASIFDANNPGESVRLLVADSRLSQKIVSAEKAIKKNFSSNAATAILEKTQQLADFMNGNGAGHQLWKNAYAINKLSGDYQPNLTNEIDMLVTYYSIQGLDAASKREIVDTYNADPEGVQNLVVYMQGLNREEDLKVTSEIAKLNGYKGYIPDQGTGGNRLVIEDDANEEVMIKRGFVKLGRYTAQDNFSSGSLSYYTTSVRQGGLYSQGVLQSVQSSYRGVDATTGLTVNGTTSGVLRGEAVEIVTDELNETGYVDDAKEVLIPVMDEDGILMYERAMNPDMVKAYTAPKSNLATMLGAWAGRQVEEKFAAQYNFELVNQLKKIWDTRETGTENLFVDLSDPKLDDKVFADTWKVISPETKEVIAELFSEEDGFMVRKDMVNLALGYREASITDVWSGKTRMPEAVQDSVKALSKTLMGDKAMSILSKSEEGYQAVVSTAKDIIVVRSLIVPALNMQANMFQLWTRGVGTKFAIKGGRDKLAEIEQYNDNVKKIIELEARIQLAGTDKNKVAVLQQQRQAVWDQNARMSIAPVITSGLYKNISEGITDMDVEITSGRLGEWVEAQVNKLPNGAQTVVKYGMVSKDTAIYRFANKAVQYGDFIAKSIYYDHLVSEGSTHDEALTKVNEEFVNFSVLPGRSRSYLESMGATWFMTFKIRIMKIAMQMLQNNPVRAMLTAGVLPDVGSPVGDNLIAKASEGTLDYAIGTDMLFGAPDLNPWINAVDFAGK